MRSTLVAFQKHSQCVRGNALKETASAAAAVVVHKRQKDAALASSSSARRRKRVDGTGNLHQLDSVLLVTQIEEKKEEREREWNVKGTDSGWGRDPQGQLQLHQHQQPIDQAPKEQDRAEKEREKNRSNRRRIVGK